MPETQQIITAVKEAGQATTEAIHLQTGSITKLADSISQLSSASTKNAFETNASIQQLATIVQHSTETSSRFAGKNGNGIWPILFGVGSLVFGLMLPLYIMLNSISARLDKHESISGHTPTSVEIATIKEGQREIETQFKGVREMIEVMNEDMKRDNDREASDISQAADLKARVRFLEREEFGYVNGEKP